VVEVEEDGGLGAQYPRVEGLGEVVGGAGGRAAEGVARVGVRARQEDDGHVLGLVEPLEVGGRPEAVHARHADAHEDELYVRIALQGLDALAAVLRVQDGHADAAQDMGEGEDVADVAVPGGCHGREQRAQFGCSNQPLFMTVFEHMHSTVLTHGGPLR
jgi:hypothetical protein